jgi:DNA repair protein RadC
MATEDTAPREGTIKALPEEDRPREKLMTRGRDSLTNAELIAILIGSGNGKESAVRLSQRILDSVGNRLADLSRLTIEDLMEFKGIGEAKAISIAAALELGARRGADEVSRKRISTSKDIYELMAFLRNLSHEEFHLVMLNRANGVLGTRLIGKGGFSGTVADPKLIFKEALAGKASSIIVVHNHPSGNRQPSESDKQLTEKLKQAGKFLDLPLLDHVIIAENQYYSFADEGTL